MKVEVLYRSHRYEEFDTSLTCPEPHRKEGVSILTDWNLYLGDLKGQGVILVQHWYDGTPPQQGENRGSFRFDDGTMVTAAVRRPGSAMLLVAPDELDGIVWLKKDGEKILWREGDDLINGERFFAMEQLCYRFLFPSLSFQSNGSNMKSLTTDAVQRRGRHPVRRHVPVVAGDGEAVGAAVAAIHGDAPPLVLIL